MVDYKVKTLKNGEKRYYKDISLGTRADGSRKRTTITAKTVKELRNKEILLRSGGTTVNGNTGMSFKEAWESYMRECEKTLSDNTLAMKRTNYNLYYSVLDTRKMLRITAHDIDDVIDSVPEEYSQNTKRIVFAHLKAFFGWSYKKQLIERNPFDFLSAPKEVKSDIKFWTEEQFRRFLDIVDDEDHRLLFQIAFYMGLRKGEICGLKHASFKGCRCLINGSVKFVEGKAAYVKELKTSSSRRTVPVPSWMIIPKGKGMLFEKHINYYYKIHEYFNKYQKKYNNSVSDELKLPPIVFHDLRHSYACYLISKGVGIYEVSRFMGHSNVNTTVRKYANLYDDIYEKVSAIL